MNCHADVEDLRTIARRVFAERAAIRAGGAFLATAAAALMIAVAYFFASGDAPRRILDPARFLEQSQTLKRPAARWFWCLVAATFDHCVLLKQATMRRYYFCYYTISSRLRNNLSIKNDSLPARRSVLAQAAGSNGRISP